MSQEPIQNNTNTENETIYDTLLDLGFTRTVLSEDENEIIVYTFDTDDFDKEYYPTLRILFYNRNEELILISTKIILTEGKIRLYYSENLQFVEEQSNIFAILEKQNQFA